MAERMENRPCMKKWFDGSLHPDSLPLELALHAIRSLICHYAGIVFCSTCNASRIVVLLSWSPRALFDFDFNFEPFAMWVYVGHGHVGVCCMCYVCTAAAARPNAKRLSFHVHVHVHVHICICQITRKILTYRA